VTIDRRLRSAIAFDASRFVAFRCDGLEIGRVRRDLVSSLDGYRTTLAVSEDGIDLRGESRASRSSAMARIAEDLAARGLLTRWRNEMYRIGVADHGRCLFEIERAAVRFFGFTAQAVHLNGLVCRDGSRCMWIARRSETKPIDPGMLDNLMGGGIGGDLDAPRTLVKECWEEAGIPADIAKQAVSAGTLRVCREVPDGLHAEVIHMYDLDLPADFVPVNQDGEVAEFRCLTLEQVAHELDGDAPYTVDAGLVAIDCLRRHGVLPELSNRD